MNNKSVFKHLLLLVTALFVLGNISLAEIRTFYVDNQIGSDGYDGLTQTVTLPAAGPKLTIQNAITAANSGDIILVKSTGITYTAATVSDGGGAKKLLTIGSYGGLTPVLAGLTLNNTSTAGVTPADEALTLNGPIQVVDLTLTAGNIVNANNLTVSNSVTRNAGTVDKQILG